MNSTRNRGTGSVFAVSPAPLLVLAEDDALDALLRVAEQVFILDVVWHQSRGENRIATWVLRHQSCVRIVPSVFRDVLEFDASLLPADASRLAAYEWVNRLLREGHDGPAIILVDNGFFRENQISGVPGNIAFRTASEVLLP